MIIAYNLCYSTCIGRVGDLGKVQKLGVLNDYFIPIEVVKAMEHDLTVIPNGYVFVKKHVREGVLPRMLNELLTTRLMVKDSMKLYRDDNVRELFSPFLPFYLLFLVIV